MTPDERKHQRAYCEFPEPAAEAYRAHMWGAVQQAMARREAEGFIDEAAVIDAFHRSPEAAVKLAETAPAFPFPPAILSR